MKSLLQSMHLLLSSVLWPLASGLGAKDASPHLPISPSPRHSSAFRPLASGLWLLASALLFAPMAHATVDDALSFAYEGATPYVKEGYTFRQDAWGGDLGLKDQKAVTAQLFKGNEYWFISGTDIANAIVTVHIYDADGKLVESEFWQKGHFSGAKVVPQHTGIYWAIITIEHSPEEETPWALVYGFK